jgi:hypothetical protein
MTTVRDSDRSGRRGVIVGAVVMALLLMPVGWTVVRSGAAPPASVDGTASSAPPTERSDVPPLIVEADAPPGGDGSAERPFGSIQQALEQARPGQTIRVGPGDYRESLRSVQPGRRDAPITLEGRDATLRGEGVDHLVRLTHDHIVLRGFALRDASTLVVISGATGVRVLDNDLGEAEGECVRIRYQSVDNEVAGNDIHDCGVEDFDLEADEKNGEGVYIGTAPEQLDDNPTDEPDASNANRVRDNRIDVPAECVDIKEDARANIVEDNVCTGSRDPEGGGLSSRGIGTILAGNRSSGHAGAGIRLGGDSDDDGTDSVVTGNVLVDNDGVGLRVAATPQRALCDNEIRGNGEGVTDLDGVDPTDSC